MFLRTSFSGLVTVRSDGWINWMGGDLDWIEADWIGVMESMNAWMDRWMHG